MIYTKINIFNYGMRVAMEMGRGIIQWEEAWLIITFVNIFNPFDMSLGCCIPRIENEVKRVSKSQEMVPPFVVITFF